MHVQLQNPVSIFPCSVLRNAPSPNGAAPNPGRQPGGKSTQPAGAGKKGKTK
jgi:hypothetical protein